MEGLCCWSASRSVRAPARPWCRSGRTTCPIPTGPHPTRAPLRRSALARLAGSWRWTGAAGGSVGARRTAGGRLNIAACSCPLGPCLLTPCALGIMFVLMCRSQVEERRRSTCSPGRRAEEAEEPKTGTRGRVVRPISLVGVRSGYPKGRTAHGHPLRPSR